MPRTFGLAGQRCRFRRLQVGLCVQQTIMKTFFIGLDVNKPLVTRQFPCRHRIFGGEPRMGSLALRKGAIAGRVTSIADTRQATQFCTFKPDMRRNSRSLLVTIVRSAALACAAIHKSLLPIGCPWDSSDARIIPYVFPAVSGIGRTGTKVLNSASNCRTFLRCLLFSAPYSSSPHVITDIAASPGSSFSKRANTFPGLWRWM